MAMVVATASPSRAQNWSSELLRGPFRVIVRAERRYSNETLPGAPEGSFCVVARAGRGGGSDNAGNGARTQK
eukprot:9796502-Alexandrium_andersonii.AAC.1